MGAVLLLAVAGGIAFTVLTEIVHETYDRDWIHERRGPSRIVEAIDPAYVGALLAMTLLAEFVGRRNPRGVVSLGVLAGCVLTMTTLLARDTDLRFGGAGCIVLEFSVAMVHPLAFAVFSIPLLLGMILPLSGSWVRWIAHGSGIVLLLSLVAGPVHATEPALAFAAVAFYFAASVVSATASAHTRLPRAAEALSATILLGHHLLVLQVLARLVAFAFTGNGPGRWPAPPSTGYVFP